MKNLITLTILIISLFGGLNSMSQTFGLRADLHSSSMQIKYISSDSENSLINPGFQIGPTVEVPINEIFSFESGLLFSTKGVKLKKEQEYLNEFIKQNKKLNLLYVDLPLTAKLSTDVGQSKIFGVLGPYVSMGLSGTYENESETGSTPKLHELDVKFGSNEEEGDLKKFDYGLTAGAGIILKSFQIGVNYSLGLADVNVFKYINNATKATNQVMGISVEYKFGKTE